MIDLSSSIRSSVNEDDKFEFCKQFIIRMQDCILSPLFTEKRVDDGRDILAHARILMLK